jgi:hypothetical protein
MAKAVLHICRKKDDIQISAGSMTLLKPFWRVNTTGSLTPLKGFQRGH